MYVATQLAAFDPRMRYLSGTTKRRGLGYAPAVFAASAGAGPAGLIVGGALAVVSLIGQIFGQHAAAVAQEANNLNGAVPAFVQGMQAIFAAANGGTISEEQAIQLCDQAQDLYYQQVAASLKMGRGGCSLNTSSPDCLWPAGSSVAIPPGANGPRLVGCLFVEPAVCAAKRVFKNGGGSFTVPDSSPGAGLKPHAGFQGQPAVTFSYMRPSSKLETTVKEAFRPASSGIPGWVLPVAGGLILAAKLVGAI